jgi:hypothetical protein
VAWSGDQQVVEAFAAQRADEAFGDRVRPRCPDWGVEDGDVGAGEHGVDWSVPDFIDNGLGCQVGEFPES